MFFKQTKNQHLQSTKKMSKKQFLIGVVRQLKSESLLKIVPGADLGGPKGPRPSLLLNEMFDRRCKNVQNSNKIASNSLQMLEIVFRTIQNSTFSGGEHSPVKTTHRRPIGLPTLPPLLSKIPGSAPV